MGKRVLDRFLPQVAEKALELAEGNSVRSPIERSGVRRCLKRISCSAKSKTWFNLYSNSAGKKTAMKETTPFPHQGHDVFMGWMRSKGAQNSNNIAVAETEHGIGFMALRDLCAGDVLQRVPLRCALTDEKICKTDIGRALKDNKSDGEFSPYVQTLPQTFSTPLYWCPRKLEWLRGTNLFSAVGAAKEELQRLQTEVVSELSRDMPELFPAAHFTLANLTWAYSVLKSRGFPARVGGSSSSEVGCLLPLIDFFNHKHRTPVEWITTDTEVVFKALPGFTAKKEEQVFTNYGGKGNEEFLLGYGFTLHDNPCDYVTLLLSLDANDELHGKKLSLLSLHGLSLSQRLYDSHIPPSLLQSLRVLVLTHFELELLESSSSPSFLSFVNVENELTMLSVLITHIDHQLSKLPSTPPHVDDPDYVNACNYVNGQRRILKSCRGLAVQLQTDASQNQKSAPSHTSSSLVASRNFMAGEVVETLKGETLSSEVDMSSNAVFSELMQRVRGLDDMLLMTLFHLHKGDALIDNVELPVFGWSESDLRSLLGTSSVAEEAMQRRQEMHSVYQQLFPALYSFHQLFDREISFEHFVQTAAFVERQSFSVFGRRLCARLCRLPRHSSQPNCILETKGEGSDDVLIRCIRPLVSGDELSISRARSQSNSELLLSFGEVEERNPFDRIDLDLGGVNGDELSHYSLSMAAGGASRCLQILLQQVSDDADQTLLNIVDALLQSLPPSSSATPSAASPANKRKVALAGKFLKGYRQILELSRLQIDDRSSL